MKSAELRWKFLDFFKDRGHKIIPSASLIPEGDSSTLFISSGMQPLVPYLLGQKHPEGTRLTDSQKSALDTISKVMKEFEGTGVQKILNLIVFDILKYVAVFPAGSKMEDSKGNVLPDCFLMPPGSTALDFAYRLHTDIGNKFVKAMNLKTKQAVGKEYIIKNLDGLEIMTR